MYITRLHATLTASQSLHWPHFAGSTLRGAFGRALRRAACVTGQPHCQGCPLRTQCAYGVVFDPAAPARPMHPSFRDGLPRYLLQAPALGAAQLQPGQIQSFALLLLPGSQAHQGLIQHTLRAAVETELFQPGLFKLTQTHVSQLAVEPNALPPLELAPHALARITLRWLTPLRLQLQGKPIFKPVQLDAGILVQALLRRQLQWLQLNQPDLPAQPGNQPPLGQPDKQAGQLCKLDTSNLHWHDIQRHSGSQNQKLPLGGLIGTTTLQGPAHALRALLPLLQLGEQLHIGKETVMGLGRYQLSAIEPG